MPMSNMLVRPVSRMARICSLIFCSMSICHLPDKVDSVDYIEAGAVVPVYEEGTGIINPGHRSFGTDGRCLHIVHLKKLHTCASRIPGAESVKLILSDHSHVAASLSGAPFFQLELP